MKRRGEELAAARLVLVARANGQPERSPRLLNLSSQSLIVRTTDLLEPGRSVHLTLELAALGQTVEIAAVVVWKNNEQGDMALSFVDLSAEGQALLSRFLSLRS